MSFCIYDSDVALCNNERVVIYNIESDTESTVQLPDLQTEKKVDHHNNVDIEAYHMITTIAFSRDGKYFLVCTNRKQLCLYERRSLELLSNRTLVRAASKVRFTPKNEIVVADKAGDAYLFSTSKPTENGTLILGHLSMLLDVLITDDEKYILTTDRDEKIRVSMFPNCYNIASYCLGHEKFVTNISELPHDKSILVSSGGDGVFILWDYRRGKELLSVDFREKISKDDVEEFNLHLKNCHMEDIVEILPAKHLRLLGVDDTSSLVVISFYSSPLLLVYSIRGTAKTNFEAGCLQTIRIKSEPVECLLYNRNLWILTDTEFGVYEFKGNSFLPNEALNSSVRRLNNFWESLWRSTLKQNLFPILYKRKFDNVQEYLERKKTRLGSTVE